MAEVKENPRVTSLMNWIRLMIPVILAALGWYIGQTVGSLNAKLELLENTQREIKEGFLEYRADDRAKRTDILRRLDENTQDHEIFITKREFNAAMESTERRIDRLENRQDNDGK